jgi:hypothetical protein
LKLYPKGGKMEHGIFKVEDHHKNNSGWLTINGVIEINSKILDFLNQSTAKVNIIVDLSGISGYWGRLGDPVSRGAEIYNHEKTNLIFLVIDNTLIRMGAQMLGYGTSKVTVHSKIEDALRDATK